MGIKSPVEKILEEIHSSLKGNFEGVLPDYIPELAKADPAHFGITLATVDGKVYEVGDTRRLLTIQSISKPFVYGLGLEDNSRADMLAKVGVEPSGEAFNSISLHPQSGRPMNPMINAGAIASTGMVKGGSAERRFERILEMFENFAGRALTVDESVYRSESATGHRNRARGVEACNKLSLHFNLHLFNVLHSVRSVVRLKYDGSQVASNRQRSLPSAALLREQGHRILVYELQGDLVFSTTEAVLRNITEQGDGVDFVILDLKRVPTLDQSAFQLFAGLADSLREAGKALVFSHAGGRLRAFVRNRVDKRPEPAWLEFADTNTALVHCEDRLHGGQEAAEVDFESLDVLADFTPGELKILRGCLVERRHARGDVIIEAGAEADEVFFLTAGRVSVRLTLGNGETKEVVAYLPGVVFGEMAFIDGSKRSASVVADSGVVCHALARADFERIGLEHPGLQVKLLLNLLRLFSANLRKADREIAMLGQ